MSSHFRNIFRPATFAMGVVAITTVCCAAPHCPDVCSSKDAHASAQAPQTSNVAEAAAARVHQSNGDEEMTVKAKTKNDAALDSDNEFDVSQIQPPAFATEAEKSRMKKLNYAVGYEVGRSAKHNHLLLVVDSFLHGLVDGMAESEHGESTFMSAEERMAVKRENATRVRKIERAEKEKSIHINEKMAEEFLQENRKKKDVVETESGLQYRIIQKGDGPSPTLKDSVVVHYRGYLLTGEEFDSSVKRNRPATFPVGRVMKGWTEALQLMHKGAKWEIFIPADLAYGQRGAGSKIGPGALLVFEIELIDILPPEQ